jgi:iron complex transport system ATP-binding protein
VNAILAHHVGVQLSHASGDHLVLSHINLEIKSGKWTSIVGPNGSGKTTLLKVLAGLMEHQGEVIWPAWQAQFNDPSKDQSSKAQFLAWMGQQQPGGDDLSVYDVAMLGRIPHLSWLDAPSERDHQAVRRALEQTQAWEWRQRRLGELSGGERQRVLLARVLAVESEVVLMDEPLSHLDPPHQVDWLHCVRSLVGQGKTVVSVLHELSMALMSDELLVMKGGRIHHQGPVHERATHQAIEAVFEHRIQIQPLGERWIAWPII